MLHCFSPLHELAVTAQSALQGCCLHPITIVTLLGIASNIRFSNTGSTVFSQ